MTKESDMGLVITGCEDVSKIFESIRVFWGKKIFPITIVLGCGCTKTYPSESDFPRDSDKCIHGNHFVLYKES